MKKPACSRASTTISRPPKMPSKDPAARRAIDARHRAKMRATSFQIKIWLPHWAVHQLDRLAIARGERRAEIIRKILTDGKTYAHLRPKRP